MGVIGKDKGEEIRGYVGKEGMGDSVARILELPLEGTGKDRQRYVLIPTDNVVSLPRVVSSAHYLLHIPILRHQSLSYPISMPCAHSLPQFTPSTSTTIFALIIQRRGYCLGMLGVEVERDVQFVGIGVIKEGGDGREGRYVMPVDGVYKVMENNVSIRADVITVCMDGCVEVHVEGLDEGSVRVLEGKGRAVMIVDINLDGRICTLVGYFGGVGMGVSVHCDGSGRRVKMRYSDRRMANSTPIYSPQGLSATSTSTTSTTTAYTYIGMMNSEYAIVVGGSNGVKGMVNRDSGEIIIDIDEGTVHRITIDRIVDEEEEGDGKDRTWMVREEGVLLYLGDSGLKAGNMIEENTKNSNNQPIPLNEDSLKAVHTLIKDFTPPSPAPPPTDPLPDNLSLHLTYLPGNKICMRMANVSPVSVLSLDIGYILDSQWGYAGRDINRVGIDCLGNKGEYGDGRVDMEPLEIRAYIIHL